jgi:hypothetical protein
LAISAPIGCYGAATTAADAGDRDPQPRSSITASQEHELRTDSLIAAHRRHVQVIDFIGRRV